MKYIFSNLIGAFVFDESCNVKDKILFRNIDDYRNKDQHIVALLKRHDAKKPEGKALAEILAYFKKKEFFSEFYHKNIAITKEGLRNSVAEDTLIVQAINSIGELDKAANMLSKRLREWYELHNPEFSRSLGDNEKFAELVLRKDKNKLLEEIGVKKEDCIGADLGQRDIEAIRILAHQIDELFRTRKKIEAYIEESMKHFCPNLAAVAGTITGAKLLEEAGSLRKLSILPSSTIQILGAEKALFRHMKTGSRPPKYGIIYSHSFIQQQVKANHGKAARALADKISIAARVDYFKGEYVGDRLNKELEGKFLK